MMKRWTINWWMTFTGGCLLQGDPDLIAQTVQTDTRADIDGAIFLALKGTHFDGHDYIEAAAAKGAVAVVIDHLEDTVLEQLKTNYPQLAIIKVSDTAQAYSHMARGYLEAQAPFVIALTGSVGKTTTRDMVAATLAGGFKVHQTKANLNNTFGVPQSVFEMPPATEIAIFELGMSKPGQISLSSQATGPRLAIITNIGTSHIGNFPDGRVGILRAKAEIIDGLAEGGVLMMNGDDPLLLGLAWQLKDRYRIHLLHIKGHPMPPIAEAEGQTLPEVASAAQRAFGAGSGILYTATPLACDHLKPRFSVQKTTWDNGQAHTETLGTATAPAPGTHQMMNSLFGLAAASNLGMPFDQANDALQAYTPTGYRQRIETCGPYTVINDAYNAAPESMKAAFQLTHDLAKEKGGRAIGAIACMAEQGQAAHDLHVEVGASLATIGLDHVFLLGDDTDALCEGIAQVAPQLDAPVFETKETLIHALLEELEPGDVILVKGSRRYGMEAVAMAIEERESRASL